MAHHSIHIGTSGWVYDDWQGRFYPEDVKVYLIIYDILGREVTRLKQEHLGAGYHQVLWNGRDPAVRDLASGNYFARPVPTLASGGLSRHRRG